MIYIAKFCEDSSTYCCGISEIGRLGVEAATDWNATQYGYDPTKGGWGQHPYKRSEEEGWRETEEEAWKAAIPKMKARCTYDECDNDHQRFPFHINLVKGTHDALSKVLSEDSSFKKIYEWNNPNTGNNLECWFCANGSENNRYEENNDDDY